MSSSQTTPTLSVICPCYNEAPVIDEFYRVLCASLDQIDGVDCEIIFMDDGSSDSTLAILNEIAAKDPRVRVGSLSRNFGHQIAITAGLDFATGDAAVMLDTDLQHPPELIPEMVRLWQGGNDVVSAVRRDTEDATWFKNVTARAFYALINWMSRTRVPEGVADFSLLSRRVYTQLRGMRENNRFVRGMVSWMGYQRAFVDYQARRRPAGQSKYTVLRMIQFAADGLLSFSSKPLRLATQFGLLVTMLGFLYLLWILIRGAILHDLVPGWASLIGVTLVLGGCQLLFIGLIGQYLARVFDEVKGRPIYLLKQTPGEAPAGSPTVTPPSGEQSR